MDVGGPWTDDKVKAIGKMIADAVLRLHGVEIPPEPEKKERKRKGKHKKRRNARKSTGK